MRHSMPGRPPARPGVEDPVLSGVRVLGPVDLIGPRGPVALSDGARRLLGVLALRPGDPVTAHQLSDAVRPGSAAPEPAVSGSAAAEPAVSGSAAAELAAALGAAGLPDALAVAPVGHLLRLPPDALDADRFTDLLARARSRMGAGDRRGAVPLYAAALATWRVPVGTEPLANCALRPGGWAAAAVNRLVQARVAAIEERWDAELRLAVAARLAAGGPAPDAATVAEGGSAAGVAARAAIELERVLGRHPLRVRLWELLLVAAFLSQGRGAAARVATRARTAFLEQVGIEPGERIRVLAQAARRDDPTSYWLSDDGPDGPGRPAGEPAGGLPPGPLARPVPARAEVPVPLTDLVGRDELLAEVDRWLATRRLVTLTGPGGAGKTRLALAVAHRRGEVRFVDLCTVESPLRVPEAVAAALGLRDMAGVSDVVAAVAEAIGPAPVLLVLDNCEFVLAGCAELVGRLLRRCPGLRVLATSRTALRVPGELPVPVPPLPCPPPGSGHTIAGLAEHPASRLFLDRARACSGRAVPEACADAVAQLCAELEGLPLAIELAAARTPSLDVREIVARIRTDQRLLRGTDRTAPERHRTLAAAIDSSVEQLDPDARVLFERLAVFVDGFDAEAVGAIAGPTAPAALAALVDASLVAPIPAEVPGGERIEVPGGEPTESSGGEPIEVPDGERFRMLAPIRRHALGRLRAVDGEETARRALAAYCLALAERADSRLRGPEQQWWLRRLRADAANLRAAMSWFAEAGAAGEQHGELRLAVALAMYQRLAGRYHEGLGWLGAALRRHPDAPVSLRARANLRAAMLAMLLCDYPAAAAYAETARVACRAAGDRLDEARVELILGSVERERARYAESGAHLATAAAIFAECGDEGGEARTAELRGFTAWISGDLDRADSRLRASLRRCERLGDPETMASALMNLGAVALYRGDPDRAGSLLDAALHRCAGLGFPEGVGWAHNLRGMVELRAGRIDRAETHLRSSLAAHRQVGDRWRTASVLEALAEVARLRGEPVGGAMLLGAADRIRTEIGAPVPACERPDVEASAQALRARLDADRGGAFDEALRYGREAPLDVLLAGGNPRRAALVADRRQGG